MDTKSLINLHFSSTYGNKRSYGLGHCQVVSWLINNFKAIKDGSIVFSDYVKYASSHGISTFNEESFNTFKAQTYI